MFFPIRLTGASNVKGITMSQQSFGQYVDEWDQLVGRIKDAKRALKVLTDKEMEMRKNIATSVASVMGPDFNQEGTTNYMLPDNRVLKIVSKVKRTVEPSMLEISRAEFDKANDKPPTLTFDDLLRTKYEVNVRPLKTLTGSAKLALSRLITEKPESPTVELD